jgi:hypothetical protein
VSVGRNDPCPCGSGRKYKKCCLLAHESAARPAPPDERAAARERALVALGRWFRRSELDEDRDAAFDFFSGGEVRPDEDPAADEEEKFFSYYCFDHVLPDGRCVADMFLERAGHRLDPEARKAVERMVAARLRPYQVAEVVLDEGLRLLDLSTDERLFVSERSATHQLHQWDLLAARVTRFDDGRRELDGSVYLLPVELKGKLLALLKRGRKAVLRTDPRADEDLIWRVSAPLIHAFWLARVVFAAPPNVVTAEGDPLELGRVAYDVIDLAAVRAALDAHPEIDSDETDSWVWFEEAHEEAFDRRSLGHLRLEGDRLNLEVTSRRRAERLRRLVQVAAGAALRHRSTRFESVEKAMARHRKRPSREAEPDLPPEEVAPLMAAYKQRHYSTWPDTALPALDGRTPRRAARLKTLRPKLVDLLRDMENHEAHAARPDNPPYDFGWIWAELGLERLA